MIRKILFVLISIILIGCITLSEEFKYGTRIHLMMEHPVSQEIMNKTINIIKNRIFSLDLAVAKVTADGNQDIYVDILEGTPSNDIELIEGMIERQGVFEAVIDGEIALIGSDIGYESVSKIPPNALNGADWGVFLTVNDEGAERFAEAANGKVNHQIYMFIDRPNDAAVFISYADILKIAPQGATKENITAAIVKAGFMNNKTKKIDVYVVDSLNESDLIKPKTNKSNALISKNLPRAKKEQIKNWGFVIIEFDEYEFLPVLRTKSDGGYFFIDKWGAIGLVAAPVLSPSVTNGKPNYHFSISGNVNETETTDKIKLANEETKKILAILKNGQLPVKIKIVAKGAAQ